jgi:1-acyl-sn-glycerol-3-phosphate acyltransferase
MSDDDVAWSRGKLGGAVREALLSLVFRPLIAGWARREVTGLENLRGLESPVIFAANHCSHIDTPLILRALPWRWRWRTAVAAASDYFYEHRLMAHAVSLAFNTVPVERSGGGVSDSALVLNRVLDEGWSLVVFAEGTRSRDGVVGRLHGGPAVLAAQHDIPIVPVYVSGTHATMPVGRRWMRRRPDGSRQRVRVAFGPAIRHPGDEHRKEVMERVRLFFESQGARTTPDKTVVNRRRALAAAAR